MNTLFWTEYNGQFGEQVEQELNSVLDGGEYILYAKDYVNGPYTYNTWGDTKNNRLFISVESGGQKVFGKITSCVAFPAMTDRRMTMDLYDAKFTEWLSDMIIHLHFEKNFNTVEEVLAHWDKRHQEHKESMNQS